MPNKDEKEFKDLLGELNFFNKLAEKGKGLFKSRDKALTHPEDCPCKDCKTKKALEISLFTKDDLQNWRGGYWLIKIGKQEKRS